MGTGASTNLRCCGALTIFQAKIKGILGREADAHQRNSKLVDALTKAGAPIPYGTTLQPDEIEDYRYDAATFSGPLPELHSPEVETLLSSPTKAGRARAKPVAPANGHGGDADLEATKRLASEFGKLQDEATATVARLNAVNAEAATVAGDDARMKRMQAEKTIALALLLGRMSSMRGLAEQLEAAHSTPANGAMERGVGGNATPEGLADAMARLRAADEVCDTLQGQLVEMEAAMGGLDGEREELCQANNKLMMELEGRRGELAELRGQAKSMLGDLEGLVGENEDLRSGLTRTAGEKIITQAILLTLKGRLSDTAAALAAAQAALADAAAGRALVGEAADTLRNAVPAVAEKVEVGADPWAPEAVTGTLQAAGEAIDALAGELDRLADDTGALEAQNDDLREEQADLLARAMELQEALGIATEDLAALGSAADERNSAVAGLETVKEGLRQAADDLMEREAEMDDLARRLSLARGEKALTQAILLSLLHRSGVAAEAARAEMFARAESEDIAETYRLALRSAADRLGRAAMGADGLRGVALGDAVLRDVDDEMDAAEVLAERAARAEAALAGTRHLTEVLAAFRAGLEDCHADILTGGAGAPPGERAARLQAAMDDRCLALRDFLDDALAGRVSRASDDPEAAGDIAAAEAYADSVRASLAGLLGDLDGARGEADDRAAEVRTLGIFRDAVRQIHDDVRTDAATAGPALADLGIAPRSGSDLSSRALPSAGDGGHAGGPQDLAGSVRQELEYALKVRQLAATTTTFRIFLATSFARLSTSKMTSPAARTKHHPVLLTSM